MALDTLSSSLSDPSSILIYETISATHYPHPSLLHLHSPPPESTIPLPAASFPLEPAPRPTRATKKKRRRGPRTTKNKEEAETQRMTHIAVERNRRRQMNELLASLRSLMPESYVLKGDQASIVGGAIDYVKELEQMLQSLEVQKRALQNMKEETRCEPPFRRFFTYPQYTRYHNLPTSAPEAPGAVVADIEVSMVDGHASIRVMSPQRATQLATVVAGLQWLRLTVLHLNVTSLESMVLYSLSAKVEEGCNLTTVEDIAAAVHHILSLVDAEIKVENVEDDQGVLQSLY